LERGLQLTWFDFDKGGSASRVEQIDGHITDALDPLPLLRCQLDASEVEREGQSLRLSQKGQALADNEFWKQLPSADRHHVGRWLTVQGEGNAEQNAGDALELIVAAALLRLGVKQVRRSVRLKVHSAPGVSARVPHAELDLLFNYGGKLWLVDCKDRRPVTDLADRLLQISRPRPNIDRKEFQPRRCYRDQLAIIDTMKEALPAACETGGLVCETTCVQHNRPSDEARAFVRRNHVRLVETCRQTSS
ncbi:MAG: hypothetical protein N3A53_00865, partial [Verrucomicrobiae bacterium]|nr:hypothetical protein [Verrucomicrobiae bacterium]